VAGDEMNEDIIQYARDEFNLLLGERTAEKIKIEIGAAHELKQKLEAPMRGRDLVSGLPKEIMVNSDQIGEALKKSVNIIVENVKLTMEETPPELLADIMDRGVVLAGGGALLRGIDQLIAQETNTIVHITEDPLTAVVRGTGIVLEDLDSLSGILLPAEFSNR
jgi:rod shape-determining protein MreB